MGEPRARDSVSFDLDTAAFANDDFRIHHFKVMFVAGRFVAVAGKSLAPHAVPEARCRGRLCAGCAAPHQPISPTIIPPKQVKRCPRAKPHDWTQCPFAHPGEKAKRRDPRRYRYSGTGRCGRGGFCWLRVLLPATSLGSHTASHPRTPSLTPSPLTHTNTLMIERSMPRVQEGELTVRACLHAPLDPFRSSLSFDHH